MDMYTARYYMDEPVQMTHIFPPDEDHRHECMVLLTQEGERRLNELNREAQREHDATLDADFFASRRSHERATDNNVPELVMVSANAMPDPQEVSDSGTFTQPMSKIEAARRWEQDDRARYRGQTKKDIESLGVQERGERIEVRVDALDPARRKQMNTPYHTPNR